MKWRRLVIVAALALGLGVLAGWGIGSVRGDCEHTCPAQGPCPTPPDCLAFHWSQAITLGALVFIVVAGLGFLMLCRPERD